MKTPRKPPTEPSGAVPRPARPFSHRHAVLPVIHVSDAVQAIRNVARAVEAGADGVFLFGGGPAVYRAVRGTFPAAWIGVWGMGIPPADADGLWTDNAGIDEHLLPEDQPYPRDFLQSLRERGWKGLYFGGVAFKYQRVVPDALLADACRAAKPYMDYVTTTGPGTGSAPARAKIAAMRKALGTHPLAIASGITPENVGSFLDIADAFLVATGISSSWEELDPARVEALIARVRAYVPAGGR